MATDLGSIVPILIILLAGLYLLALFRVEPSFPAAYKRKLELYVWKIEFSAKTHNYYLKQMKVGIAILLIIELILLLNG